MPTHQTTVRARWAFSLKRQEAYGTALADVDIDKSHSATAADFVENSPDMKDDKAMAFKGHDEVTETWIEKNGTALKRTFQGSSYIMPWVMFHSIGNGVTSQPDAVGSPLVYLHEMWPLRADDPAYDPQLPPATVIEQPYPGKQRKYRDLICKGFTLTGQETTRLQVESNWVGSGYVQTSAIEMPELVQVSYLVNGNAQMTYNGVNITPEVKDFSFKYDNTLNEDDYGMGSPSYEQGTNKIFCRKSCVMSGKTHSFSFKMMLDSDMDLENDFWQNTERAVVLTCEGDAIQNTYKHKLIINAPKCIIKTRKVGQDKGYYIIDCECTMKYDSGIGAAFKISVQNNVPEYLAMPGD